MREDYIIHILTEQNVDGQKETLEMTSRAALQGEGMDYTITYQMGGYQRHELKINQNDIEILKKTRRKKTI